METMSIVVHPKSGPTDPDPDPTDPPAPPSDAGGCSTSHGATGWVVSVLLFGLGRRRRW